jgi:hypothetical protein
MEDRIQQALNGQTAYLAMARRYIGAYSGDYNENNRWG